jgi:sugar O-acyltransferase (sialic acid O-acetyltransferase NeuD family)
MKKLVIYGASELAKLAHYYFAFESNTSVSAFVVDKQFKDSDEFLGCPVLSWEDNERELCPSEISVFVAIGYRSMERRAKAFESVRARGYSCPNLISSSAFVAKNVKLGMNNFIMPGTVVEPGVEVGDNNVFWSNSTICHDTQIGNHNFFAANVTIGGEGVIGCKNFFGFSSVVRERCRVGDRVLLGANSLLLQNIPSGVMIYGSPAKIVSDIKESESSSQI